MVLRHVWEFLTDEERKHLRGVIFNVDRYRQIGAASSLITGNCLMCGRTWSHHSGLLCSKAIEAGAPGGYFVTAQMLLGAQVVQTKAAPDEIVELLKEVKASCRDALTDEQYERVDRAIEALSQGDQNNG